MEEHGVVPQVIDTVPLHPLEVVFPSNKNVNSGNVLTPTDVKEQPMVKWDAAADSFYTLVMTDPDAPSRQDPKFSEVRHWLVVNIPGSDLAAGETIAEFISSGPPKDTGLHRYIFLVYKQSGKISFDEPKSPKMSRANRFHFSVRKFSEKYNLGQPVYGNFYQAEWDPYVEIRNQNIVNE